MIPCVKAIAYNHLNLPEHVSLPNGDYVKYTYSSVGQKLRKEAKTGANTKISDYIGPMHYENNALVFMQHAEGRVRKNGSSYAYEYNLTDHLGNVRVSVSSTGSVIQRDDYYPFGLTFNHYDAGQYNKYLYNQGTGEKTFSTERQSDIGWDMTKYRMYDYALGRFISVDPLAEIDPQESWSPYQYAYNNPIRYNDPYGDCPPGAPCNHPLGSNPLYAVAEGFRRIGDAALSLASVTAEVFMDASRTLTPNVPVSSTTVSTTANAKTSIYVKVNLSGVLDANPNNEVVLPKNIVEAGTKATQSVTTAVKSTFKLGNFPINTSWSTTQNSNESSSTTAEVSTGLDKGNVQMKVFASTTSSTSADGSTTNTTSLGVKVQVPVYKDGQSTVSVGTQFRLDHEGM